MSPKRRWALWALRVLIIVCVLWGALAAFALYRIHATKAAAEAFLSDFTKIQVGRSTMDKVKQLASKHHGKWRPNPTFYEANPCGAGASVVEFSFENRWPTMLVLFSPRTMIFGADIYVKHNVVCYRGLSMWTNLDILDPNAPEALYSVDEFSARSSEPSFSSSFRWTYVFIHMDVRATPEARNAAFSVNLDCLSTVWGCRSTREMAPQIWKNSSYEPALDKWSTKWDSR